MNLIDEITIFPETQAHSWRGWRSVIARIEGLEPEDPAFIARVTGRTDRTPTRELFAALGRSAGKTRFASVVAAAFAMRRFEHAIGEQIYLALFAPTVAQARIAHGYIAGLLQSNPTTATLISGEITQTTIPLGDLVVECLASNYKTLRSRSYGLVIVDEACFLPHEDSAIPDTELLRAVRPGLARVKGSRLLVISSPYARRGEMYKAYERHFGQAGHDTLFLKGTTLDFNPTFDQREIDRAMEEDPEAARAEYLGEFRSDLETLFSIERIAAVTPTGVFERSSSGLQHLRAFVDPSGGSSDSFTLGIAGTGGETYVGTINAQNQVEQVQTWIDNTVLGDTPVETTFSEYRDFGGVMFPGHIVRTQGGHPVLDITVSQVAANPASAASFPVPEAVTAFTPPAVTVDVEQLADGVYYMRGGSHHSIAIDQADHIVVVEGPQSEERSNAVIAKVKETIPNKPIRYVINTHVHFDHSGGLRTYVDEGATVVTHALNRPYYEQAWAAPRTLNPDRLATSGKSATFETVTGMHVLTDGKRSIEIREITGNGHNDAFLMVYLPAERILSEADAWTPAAANAPPPATPNPFTVSLYENVQRLKLPVRQIAAIHGPRVATLADLRAAAMPTTATN